jgi:genome maintenance exonuclease 1
MMNDEDVAEYHNIGKKKIMWDGKPKFDYQTIKRVTLPTGRVYDINQEKLPSVTTILSATKSEESKAKLAAWRQREGEIKADKIRDDAAARGTIMHRILEGYIKGEGHMDLSDLGKEAGIMAQNIIDKGHFSPLEEVWGLEMPLWYPGLYAGASDVAGIYEGRESIIDFKPRSVNGLTIILYNARLMLRLTTMFMVQI